MSARSEPFERKVALSDAAVFRDLVGGMKGEQCRRVDELYGGAFSLHFGEWLPAGSSKGRERGSWVITAWGCDVRMVTRDGTTADDRIVEREQIVASARDLERARLDQIELDPSTTGLRLIFIGGSTLELIFDPAYNGDAWTLSLPSRQTIALTVGRRWSLEDDIRRAK